MRRNIPLKLKQHCILCVANWYYATPWPNREEKHEFLKKSLPISLAWEIISVTDRYVERGLKKVEFLAEGRDVFDVDEKQCMKLCQSFKARVPLPGCYRRRSDAHAWISARTDPLVLQMGIAMSGRAGSQMRFLVRFQFRSTNDRIALEKLYIGCYVQTPISPSRMRGLVTHPLEEMLRFLLRVVVKKLRNTRIDPENALVEKTFIRIGATDEMIVSSQQLCSYRPSQTMTIRFGRRVDKSSIGLWH